VIANLITVRKPLSQTELAGRVTKLGVTMNRSVVANLESRQDRTRRVTIEELFAFALALNVSPLRLLLPVDEDELVAVTPETSEYPTFVKAWLRGDYPLPRGADHEEFHRLDDAREQRARIIGRRPEVLAVRELETHLRAALAGSDEVLQPGPLAQALRHSAERVAAYVNLLADEVEAADEITATGPVKRNKSKGSKR
jgi:transcriptional regulator with XRE-family HTH domain